MCQSSLKIYLLDKSMLLFGAQNINILDDLAYDECSVPKCSSKSMN